MEAANSEKEYMEEFAELIAPVLQYHFAQKFPDCFEKQPKVDVNVVELTNEKEVLDLKECPDELK